MKIVVGIDASRSRSGGAFAHLIGILNAGNIEEHGIKAVHVWSHNKMLNLLPQNDWILKHSSSFLEMNLFAQVFWQIFVFPYLAKRTGCDIVLNTSAATFSRFKPSVTMSREALSYEANEMKRYGLSFARIRLLLLKVIQNSSLRSAEGCIFLTNYIADLIQQSTGSLTNYRVIPHGVGDEFRRPSKRIWPRDAKGIRVTYVSNIAPYKHQWHVVRAISRLRKKGFDLILILAGGTDGGRAQALLDQAINDCDPDLKFVNQIGHINNSELPALLSDSNLFLFASSCETISNTLLESMASGLPVACSNRGPMPEVLQDAGVYFDPEDPLSISDAVESLLNNTKLRELSEQRVLDLSSKYSWQRCANETWSFLRETYDSQNS